VVKNGLERLLRAFGHSQRLLRFEEAFVVRGSPGRTPDAFINGNRMNLKPVQPQVFTGPVGGHWAASGQP
jgi:hypothetical protein